MNTTDPLHCPASSPDTLVGHAVSLQLSLLFVSAFSLLVLRAYTCTPSSSVLLPVWGGLLLCNYLLYSDDQYDENLEGQTKRRGQRSKGDHGR